jgi:hypothetical protein
VKYKYLERMKAIIHVIIQFNTIQIYLFTRRPNSAEANHKASASKREKTQTNKKTRTKTTNINANKIIIPLK